MGVAWWAELMEIAHWRIRDLVFIIIGTMNLLWSILPHLYMLLTPQTPRNHLNTSSSLPLSSLGMQTRIIARILSLLCNKTPCIALPFFTFVVHRSFPESDRLRMKDEARRMFYWGYNNYMRYAFPHDELDPIHCKGRGHDWDDP